MPLKLIVAIALILAWLYFLRLEKKRNSSHQQEEIREAADRIFSDLGKTYSSFHEFVPALPTDFADRDLSFYDHMAQALCSENFVLLGDVEDRTLSQTYPQNRTFVRILVSNSGSVQAAIFDVTPKGFLRLSAWLFGMRHMKIVELQSELQNGHFVVTTLAPCTPMEKPVQIHVIHLSHRTTIRELISAHIEHLAKQTAAQEGSKEQIQRTLNDVLASQGRQLQILHEFRKGVGFGLTEKEKEGFAKGSLSRQVTADVFSGIDELADKKKKIND